MTTAAPKIMSTERVRQRFNEEQIRLLVDRSLYKMSESPEPATEWVSHYRTVYGDVTVVYAKEPHSVIVAYDDEIPKELMADPKGNGSGYPPPLPPQAEDNNRHGNAEQKYQTDMLGVHDLILFLPKTQAPVDGYEYAD